MKAQKLDPTLLNVLEDFDDEGDVAIRAHARSSGLHAASGQNRPPFAVVFVECNARASFDQLQSRGITFNQSSGRIRTAAVPLVALSAMTDDPDVIRVVGSRYLRPRLDLAAARVNLPAFVHRTSLRGTGVVIGIVDSGIDSAHPAFAGRVLSVWDQTLPGVGVAEGAYGTELTAANFATSRDDHGHGTHVAGIAAGDHGQFGGVAPRAELVIVKTDFDEAHIGDAIRYVFRIAGAKDAVVNLSLGGHGDPHDGSDLLSQLIDQESGPGRIVCVAAGNEGNDNIHGQARLPAGAARSMRFRVPPAAVGVAVLNGWYGGAAQLEVAVRTPTGFVTPFQPIQAPPAISLPHALPGARIRMATPGVNGANGDINFQVQLRGPGPGTAVEGGVWQLLTRNVAQTATVVDVWVLDDLSSSQIVFSGTSVRDNMKIGSPGTAASAITVASFTTRIGWVDAKGIARNVSLVPDDISDFSSEGPLRNQAQKPDLAAPGAWIASAESQHSHPDPATRIAANYVLMPGTSMATPFVTGLVALLLERQPKLTPAQAKALLAQHCSIPTPGLRSPHPKWGAGLIDAQTL